MRPDELFERVKSLWPEAIVLNDPQGGGGDGPLWSIVNTHEAIEEQIEADNWLSLGAWAFYQALSDLAAKKISARERVVMPGSVSLASFDKYMRDNLADKSWASERLQYGRTSDES